MHRLAATKRLLHRHSSSSSWMSAKQIPPIPIPIPIPFPNRVARPRCFRFVSSATFEPPPPPPPSDHSKHHHHEDPSHTPRTPPTLRATSYEQEQLRVLAASLRHVMQLGWSEAALIAGARDVSVSPSIVGAIPRKQAALVEYFMDECLQKLIDMIDSGDLQLKDLVASERIAKLIKARLQLQAPFISKWPQALSIQAQPSNISTSFKQRAMLVDEFCHAANDDEGGGVDWYLKRSVIGGIYSATEVYMLTDNSTDFCDTWVFLNERVRDAFDLKKTFQEVKYFAEAVGAGLGSSLDGFTKKGI